MDNSRKINWHWKRLIACSPLVFEPVSDSSLPQEPRKKVTWFWVGTDSGSQKDSCHSPIGKIHAPTEKKNQHTNTQQFDDYPTLQVDLKTHDRIKSHDVD